MESSNPRGENRLVSVRRESDLLLDEDSPKARMATASPKKKGESTPARQLEGFIAKFDPAVARVIRAARAKLRRRFPTAFELAYDNYNFLAIGYSATERPSDCIVSLAANAKGVGLSFYYGATLPDPAGILLGSGNQNRFVRLPSAARLDDAPVVALIRAAVAQARTPPPSSGRGATVIRSISARQRPRRLRPKAASRKAAARSKARGGGIRSTRRGSRAR